MLGIFFLCALLGVIIFAAATSAQHPSKETKKASIARLIAPLGIAHTVLLIGDLLSLGWILYGRVIAVPDPVKQTGCCCRVSEVAMPVGNGDLRESALTADVEAAAAVGDLCLRAKREALVYVQYLERLGRAATLLDS